MSDMVSFDTIGKFRILFTLVTRSALLPSDR